MIVYPLFSMFILLFSGYLAKRVRIISPNSAIVFLDFVLWFALPALIFDKVYHLNIDTTLISVIIVNADAISEQMDDFLNKKEEQ